MVINQEKSDLIFSVESRKGGVGKTTAALCMARLLLKKGYAVLVLDLDITGTNAAHIVNSPFWVTDLYVVYEVDEKGSRNDPVNLITLFDRCFMSGMTIPRFLNQDSSSGALKVDLKKVNVMGSQIYMTEQKDNNTWTTSIERPSILFDDLHTLWLLEFVKQIISNFEQVVRSNQQEKYAIVLDNSPGYVGIAPAIHEWLTDLGPDRGKFLTVTSLDTQDLRACGRAIEVLHGLYTSKWRTSRTFKDAGKEGSGINISKDQEAFFMRLASSTIGSSKEEDPLAFYRDSDQILLENREKRGQRFCDHPSEYIAAIINRVPRSIKTGQFVYDYEFYQSLSQRRSSFISVLGSDYKKNNWRSRMISYDEYIENQFLLQPLRRGRRQSERRVHHLIDVLKMAEDELRVESNKNSNDQNLFKLDNENLERLRKQITRANNILSHACSAVEDAGLGHLTRLIHDEWLPGSIIPNFRSWLLRLLRESDLPYFEFMPFEFEPNRINSEAHEFIADLKKHIKMELRHSELKEFGANDSDSTEILLNILSGLVGLSLSTQQWHSPLIKELSGLLAGILVIELKHWARRGEGKSRKFGIQHFLAQESISQVEIRKDIELFRPLRFFQRHMMEEEIGIIDFYNACTSSQARLIDYEADSLFLLQLLRFIVKGEMEKGDLFPFVRGIAEDVIINKTLPHSNAPEKMAKALKTAEYFREFDGVLNDILMVWGVTND